MNDNTRNSGKENTFAHWRLLSKFINSPLRYSTFESPINAVTGEPIFPPYKCTILADDLAILMVLSRYLDMKNGVCFLGDANFANESGLPLTMFKRRKRFLIQNGFILIILRKCKPHYFFGEQFNNV